MSALLEIEGLSVFYGKVEAVHGASMCVETGSVVSVIGANGAGKTSLLAAIMGLLPCTGKVRLYGADASQDSAEQRVRSGLCLVPERRELFAEMSVEKNLMLGAFTRARQRKLLMGDLEKCYQRFPKLKERRHQVAGTLSGGERQLVAIGRALMARPRLIMLDEPSLGLSPLMVKEMFRVITDLRTSGVSVLLVEQNARAALQVSDYAYVLDNGEVVLRGPASTLASDPRVAATYLGLGASGEHPSVKGEVKTTRADVV